MKSRNQFHITVFFLEPIIKLIHEIVSKYDMGLVWLDFFFRLYLSFIENEEESIFFCGTFLHTINRNIICFLLCYQDVMNRLWRRKGSSNDTILKLSKNESFFLYHFIIFNLGKRLFFVENQQISFTSA